MNKGPSNPIEDIVLIQKLDGLHALNRKTGLLIWSTNQLHSSQLQPIKTNKNIKDSNRIYPNENGVEQIDLNAPYIIEPAGNGDFYYVEPGEDIGKSKMNLKDIISDGLGVRDGSKFYAGSKITQLLAIDPFTGEILKTFGGSQDEVEIDTTNVVYVERTHYSLEIHDLVSDNLLWNISYVEYQSADTQALKSKFPSTSIIMDVSGKFKLHENGYNTEYINPVVGIFDIVGDLETGRHLQSDGCFLGAPGYPSCLTLTLDSALLDATMVSNGINLGNISIFTFTIFLLFVGLKFWWRRPKKVDELSQSTSSSAISSGDARSSIIGHGLKALKVSDKVIGLGSHGTVVLEGTFEGRKVAIKRMLADFYKVSDHEVDILQQSDVHPNVVRYFFREVTEEFTFIALELCLGSLADLVQDKTELLEIKKELSDKQIFSQIIAGLLHIHSLGIVHRDIKPHNILVSNAIRGFKTPRVLISDFGLGKRLTEGQSSFHNTYENGRGLVGTTGYRPPESLMAYNAKSSGKGDTMSGVTKAVDIFAAGCVFYYVFSKGLHPFGEQYARETNILKGNFRLHAFEGRGDLLLKNLVVRMISRNPFKRPTAIKTLKHPYFWSCAEQLSFLLDLSDRLDKEIREPLAPMLKNLAKLASKTIGDDWISKINSSVLETMSKYRKYDGSSVLDLLRVIRNKKHHYIELPEEVKSELGNVPDGFLNYFKSRFPNLMTSMVAFVESDPGLAEDPLFKHYIA